MFKCDKQKSLTIIKNILEKLKEGDVCINEGMNVHDHYSNYEYNVVDLKHKLMYIEIEISDEINKLDEIDDINDLGDIEEDYNCTDKIEIYHNSDTDNDQINLCTYLHNSSSECDVSYPTFIYHEKHQCWVICDDFWGSPNGIPICILSFENYPECRI